MGTRADFYVGRGADAEWLGSVAYDGYPDGMSDGLLAASIDAEWRERLGAFLARRDDATVPADGWPWPWDDSRTTDYAYAFDGGKVWASSFGGPWFDPLLPEPEHDRSVASADFPDMKARKNVTIGPRSGLIVLGVKP